MSGTRLVALIVVATVIAGGIFLRNRMAADELARQQLQEAQKARETGPKATGKASDAPAAKAAPAQATPPAAPAGDGPLKISSRIVQMPRKKPMAFQVDLDGDGRKEQLAATQRHPGPEHPGLKRAEATVFVGPTEGEATAPGRRISAWGGYMHGFWRLAMGVGGGAYVAFYQRSLVDESTPVAAWLAMVDGKPATGLLDKTPLEVIDVEGRRTHTPGVELVTMLSNELYQDFFPKGTMDVARWNGRGFESTLPEPAFELCALDPGLGRPIAFAAVTREAPHRLQLLGWNGGTKRYVARQSIAVSPPDDGADFHVEKGFALACFASHRGSTDQHVQYKNRHFAFREARLHETSEAAPSAAQAP